MPLRASATWLQIPVEGRHVAVEGHQIINRFSENIDILIEPPAGHVKIGKNQNSAAQIKTRTDFYDWLAQTIKIDGISSVERDTAFDDTPNYRGAGIRLNYESVTEALDGLREGVLLEGRLRHRGSQYTERHQFLDV